MKLLNSKNFKLHNKTFDWTSNFVVSREQDSKEHVGSVCTERETQKPYETDQKMEMTKPDRPKTSFSTLFGPKISIVVTEIDQKPKEIMM